MWEFIRNLFITPGDVRRIKEELADLRHKQAIWRGATQSNSNQIHRLMHIPFGPAPTKPFQERETVAVDELVELLCNHLKLDIMLSPSKPERIYLVPRTKKQAAK